MGSKPKAKVVNYDASIKNAQMQSRSLELLSKANTEALTSQRLAMYAGTQAKSDIEHGLSLLGNYLKDRNQMTEAQTPIMESFLSKSNEISGDYASKASGVLSKIKEGYS